VEHTTRTKQSGEVPPSSVTRPRHPSACGGGEGDLHLPLIMRATSTWGLRVSAPMMLNSLTRMSRASGVIKAAGRWGWWWGWGGVG
jgi:hypothetical protein